VVVKANTLAKPAAGAKSAAKPAAAKPAAVKPVVAAAKPAAVATRPAAVAVKPVAVAAKPVAVAAKPALPAAKPAPKPAPKDLKDKDSGFRKGDFVVYPTHGVGKILGVETQEVSGHSLQLIIIHFEKDRMTLRVPVAKAKNSGLRKLSSRKVMDAALQTLKGRSRVKRAMWSRRAQEYEAKINSGDPVSIAEVVRDLHRNADQPDQSYSERQIYQAALDRLVRELAAIDGIDEQSAHQRLHQVLKAVAA
jgi:CarD family transcriptional regulator